MKATEFKGIYASDTSIRMEFIYQAIRCRETIRGTPTKTRLAQVHRWREEILFQIDTNTFDYAIHFPNSKRAFEFSSNKAALRTVAQAVDFWYRHNSSNWAKSTYRGYTSKVNTHILPNWGNMALREFKPIHLKEWMADALLELSPKTVNEVRSILSCIFKEQIIDEVLETNPVDKTKPAKRERKEVNPFNAEEREKILNELPDNSAKHLYQFAFATGLRTGELLGLTWQDIDLEKGRLYIRQSWVNGKQATTKTKSSSRTHELHPDAISVLHQIKQYHPDQSATARVFLDPRTLTPWKYDGVPRERFWKPALKAANIPYRTQYTCRHTYASTMLTQGKDPTWLAKQMGHKDWGMIRMIYARWID